MEELKTEKHYLYFGTYPQSKKAESVTVGTEADENGYYSGSDGEKYAIADGEYFKVEPIKWQILQEKGGTAFLLSESILDAFVFDVRKNHYAKSKIRSLLNGEFYQRAFGAAERERIIPTDVDNGLESTGDDENPYTCENTQDNVFLLSYREAFKSLILTDAERQKKVTPYADKSGVFNLDMDNNCGWWWLRTPCFAYDHYACTVPHHGKIYSYSIVYYNNIGIVPALWIKL